MAQVAQRECKRSLDLVSNWKGGIIGKVRRVLPCYGCEFCLNLALYCQSLRRAIGAGLELAYKKLFTLALPLCYGSPNPLPRKLLAVVFWLSSNIYSPEAGGECLVDKIRSPVLLPRAAVEERGDLRSRKRGVACIEQKAVK